MDPHGSDCSETILLDDEQGVGDMAKKQSRRSISVRGVTYNQLREHCCKQNISMSDFLEQRVADYFTEHKVKFEMPGTTMTKPPPAKKPAPRPLPSLRPLGAVAHAAAKHV